MVLKIKEYDSAEKIEKALDAQISETKSTLGKYLRRLDDIRVLAEKTRKVREVVMKLSSSPTETEALPQVTVGSLSIVMDANPLSELTATESAVQSHQEHLLVLQKTRGSLKWLDQFDDTDGIKYNVVENGGIPERIMFKFSPSPVQTPPKVTVSAPIAAKPKV